MKTVPNVIPARRTRVVVADDSTVAREGIAAIVAGELGYALCGLATDQVTTGELVKKHQPDLLVIEPFLGHYDGIFVLKELAARFPRTRILAVSRQPEENQPDRTRTRDQPENRGNLSRTHQAQVGILRR